jgi:hypothetical protein
MLVSASGLTRLINEFHPMTHKDHNRWLEYSTPRYQTSSFDWFSHNVRLFSQYQN